ncbi:MAG: DUF4132 domain-containing protein [Candidatus Treponema excrementipullorum]|nr:DUF4132 domain-containing protein [Spirochaetia bacterium]MDY4465069.1 DUF4132 domain-containing protein [Candidatus Treponema excrementipullorum]MDY4708898.1 DUF4132 domain-containing protein [Candidatus Treponema excrementipullorum]
MNIQPNKPEKPDTLGQLFQLWRLRPANQAIARAYLMDDQAEDKLLSGVKRQIFSLFEWHEQWEINKFLKEITVPAQIEKQSKILRFLWAIGHSTAGFAAIFDYNDITSSNAVSDSTFHQRCEVLGSAAAAAMDAEYAAAVPTGYDQIARLYKLASTTPTVLLEAQKLIADPRNSMADIVITGVLLANTDPAEKEPSLLEKLFGMASTSQWAKVERLLARTDDIVESASGSGLSSADIGNLKCYIHAGDSSAPVPNTQVPTAWQLPEQDIFDSLLANEYAVECMAACIILGLQHDHRLICALRVLAGLNLCDTLQGILNFLPPEWDISFLDTLLPHIPGGAVTVLRFAAKALTRRDKEIIQRYYENVDTALQYCNSNEYINLCKLLLKVNNGENSAWMGSLRRFITDIYVKRFMQGPLQTIVHDYLSGQGNFADSMTILNPIHKEFRYIFDIGDILCGYQKVIGWDEFACRWIIISCLTCPGSGVDSSFSSFSSHADMKQNMNTFVNSLIVRGLPMRDCITVLASLYENLYQGSLATIIEEAIQENFVTPAALDVLADAAQNGSSAARILAIKGLDALSADHVCAESARKALILCAADTSKQVQEVLIECFTNHPDWEQDYLTMLGSKKAAVRSLAIRILAGIDTEKYRTALEGALTAEKNAKVTAQISALLGLSDVTDANEQTTANLIAQTLKGGKKRKVQWLLEQSLPVVHHTDESQTPASEEQIAALFVAYADLGRMGRSDTAAAIAADLDKKDLEALACEVWELWFKAGAQSKTKWVLPFAAVFGGAAMTPKLIRAINDWPQNARGAIACDAVAALSVSPDPAALVTVDSISRKFKFRQVKAAATAALESAAKELGITTEELADRIVPTLDFAPDGTRIFDYGSRKFIVRLTPSLELVVNTEAGKTVKSMPAPGKTDDAEKATAAYEAYKTLKKQLKTTVTAQRARLELALSAQRCWDSKAWRKLFVENPVMHQFAISLIWGVYENGKLQKTFRYMEDGSFNTADEEEYTLPDGADIGLVHPIELDKDVLAAWKQQLEDYEITQSIQQLSRPVFRLPAEQAQAPSLETAAGRILSALSLSGKLQGMGWYRGSVLDGGFFHTFYREDPAVGIGVDLNFSGIGVGCEDEEITVFDAVFYDAGTVDRGSYCYDVPQKEHIILLGQVPARYYSEIVWQLECATASAAKTDPDWRSKKN